MVSPHAVEKLGLAPEPLDLPLPISSRIADAKYVATSVVRLKFSLEQDGETHERKFYLLPYLDDSRQHVVLGVYTMNELGMIPSWPGPLKRPEIEESSIG